MKNEINIPEDILGLIPWFAINKLSSEDQIIFESALIDYPSLKQQLEDESKMIAKITANNSIYYNTIFGSSEERLKTVWNIIDKPETSTATKISNKESLNSNLFAKLKNIVNVLIPNHHSMPQFARVAGLGGLVLSVAVLTTLAKPLFTHTSDFVPASAVTQPTANQPSEESTTQTILLVGFNGSSEELSNIDALKGKQLNIESPPDKEGFFQVSFKQAMDSNEIKTTIDALLKHKEAVWFAGEAF